MDKRGINVGVTKDPCYSRGILSVAALVPWLRPAPAIISSIRAPIIKGHNSDFLTLPKLFELPLQILVRIIIIIIIITIIIIIIIIAILSSALLCLRASRTPRRRNLDVKDRI